ncbi:integrase [Anaerohalosphaera lusitana]|uniref:Integrase n=1 Tax=Anaerohalosphaera lusitana TaxID=1936003 RepID=A0A1U9NLG1_9BACT|nr:tyrosine-type recombinase/integrase [Anaerohalosphaera lusitana]AQT68771.1 integrase [Anaerohalosphaera lusitana]
MAHTRVSVNRNYYGKVPLDKTGKPIPKNLWAKRRKSSWEVRWYDSEGKRLSKSFKDRKEAYDYARSIQDKVDIGKSDKPRQITLRDFTKEHKKLMKGQVAHSTLKDQMRALDLFKKHVNESILLEKITPRCAESFVSERLSQGLSPATVNKDIRTLKSIFNRAISPRGYLPEGANPFEKIKQRKVADKPVKYVSAEEFSKVFDVANNLWWKTFLSVAYTTAGRKDELLNLTWADINFENNEVSFAPKRETDTLLSWEPKDHESRIVPAPESVMQYLADLQNEADEFSPYVFITSRRLMHILERRSKNKWDENSEIINNMLTRLKRFCRQAKVSEFCFHDLRRSCMTNWAKVLPIHVVQELAGHSKIETTRKYYLSVGTPDREMARKIQEQLLGELTNF